MTTRQQLMHYLDAIPDRKLKVLKPLLRELAQDAADEYRLVIETDLTDDERVMIAEGTLEYEEHPEQCISLEDYVAGAGRTRE